MMASLFRPRQAQGQAQPQQELQVLGSMQLRHLVALLGWRPEEHCLVYELAEKGTLVECLPSAGLGLPHTHRHRATSGGAALISFVPNREA
jgi:hypothetical protein